ncbi:hypothetical protein AVEN_127536-1 [Araneus ventricosus]|uniref:Uncharacterized protein n=1 Tax=Araneus ventricosus TaxID=182803 RepID=A0A4Y2HRQ7_ARAVE|nr:hypothetical protein AVEN_127536-1 [Araneus ventricosus]
MPVIRSVEIIRHYCPPTIDAKPLELQTLLTGIRRILTSSVAGGRKELDERKRNEMRFGERACVTSGFVNKAKVDFLKAKHLVGLSWVKAHVGNEVNDLADEHAKLATIIGEDHDIPVP